MEEEEGGRRLSKRVSEKGGEVDYKDKAGTAWSHSYLNQKPWHPLSYPNQRRKWIAEQTHAQRERRAEEVAREFSQEQEFFRQTALISKKEKEKVEMMKAVSFMYVRPPGYNAESAKAAEIADERRRLEQDSPSHVGPSTEMPPESAAGRNHPWEERKKPRPKDVFGRPLPTEEEFEVLKNAPRLETGVPARVKPFGVEVRNVKCVRCGNFGHQSGDRECPLKDAIMPNEESRLKRDDPLTAILAHTDASEPLKWELKQKPGISPPRGGFKPDDPNQQIVSEDIFDEYGGFLSGENIIPGLLTNFSSSNLPKKRKSSRKGKHKRLSSPISSQSKDPQLDEAERRSRKDNKHRKKKRDHSESSCSSDDDSEDYGGRRSKRDNKCRKKKKKKRDDCESSLSDNSEDDMAGRRSKKEDNMYKNKNKNKKRTQNHSEPSSFSDNEKRRLKKDDKFRKRRNHPESSSSDDNPERSNKGSNYRKKRSNSDSSSSDNSEFDRHHHHHKKSRNKRTTDRRNSSENIDPDKHYRSKNQHLHH